MRHAVFVREPIVCASKFRIVFARLYFALPCAACRFSAAALDGGAGKRLVRKAAVAGWREFSAIHGDQ